MASYGMTVTTQRKKAMNIFGFNYYIPGIILNILYVRSQLPFIILGSWHYYPYSSSKGSDTQRD